MTTVAADADKLQWAKISSIAGGAIILGGAVLFWLVISLVTGIGIGFGPRELGLIAGVAYAFFLVAILGSVLLGGLVLYGAFQYDKPNGRTWAIVVLVTGAVAFFTGAGLFLGAVLAIVGGALAFSAIPAPRA